MHKHSHTHTHLHIDTHLYIDTLVVWLPQTVMTMFARWICLRPKQLLAPICLFNLATEMVKPGNISAKLGSCLRETASMHCATTMQMEDTIYVSRCGFTQCPTLRSYGDFNPWLQSSEIEDEFGEFVAGKFTISISCFFNFPFLASPHEQIALPYN